MRDIGSIVVLVAMLVGCAVEGDSDTADASTETGDPVVENHGSVRVEAAPLTDPAVFDGTTEVIATVQYETCLQDFYLARQPGFQQGGPDGEPVFTDWAARLCSGFDDLPACDVTAIEQTLSDENATYTLSVTFQIHDASTLDGRDLHIGPLPLEAFAACEEGLYPRVELRQTGLIGNDAQGQLLWRIATLPATNVAVADQGAPIRVQVIAVTP